MNLNIKHTHNVTNIIDCDKKCSIDVLDFFILRNGKCICIDTINSLHVDKTILETSCNDKTLVYQSSRIIDDSLCDINCPGDSDWKCGDTNYVTVYKSTEYPVLSSDNLRHITSSALTSSSMIGNNNGVTIDNVGNIFGRLSINLNTNNFSYICSFIVNDKGKYMNVLMNLNNLA